MERRGGCASARPSICSPPPDFTRFWPFQALPAGCGTRATPVSSRPAPTRVGLAHELAAAVGALLDLDLALGKPLRPDQDLPRNANQVGGGEFGSRPLIKIVVEHFDSLAGELAVKPLAGGVGVGATLLEIIDCY